MFSRILAHACLISDDRQIKLRQAPTRQTCTEHRPAIIPAVPQPTRIHADIAPKTMLRTKQGMKHTSILTSAVSRGIPLDGMLVH